jgi:CRP-like cAMP-binding protein
MVFMLIMYIHILACILWLVFKQEQVWIPEADFIYAETKLYKEHFIKQYLSMAYHAIMVFGINEVAPVQE